MDQLSINELRRRADIAFKDRDFKTALQLSEQLVKEQVPEGYLTAAIISEHGWDGSDPDLQKAMVFYSGLCSRFNAREGYLGVARIYLKKAEKCNAERAERHCLHVVEESGDPIAYLLLGRVYEELFGDGHLGLAARNYLKAGLRGSAWAWRKYAQVKAKTGHHLVSLLAHIFATVISPALIFFGGMRLSRRG